MSFNLTAGNPRAHRIRVYYTETASTIYEGMPVCFNFDTTTNWFGGSMTNGAVTASTSLTAGTPSTGTAKYMQVEDPDSGNIQWFAGVVAAGGWCGRTGGRSLDIFIPNGAIVPVRAGVACTEGRTVLSVISATQYLGHALSATQARPVAISEETVDRSTAGLVLAKLDDTMFLYQDNTGDALYVGTGATAASASQIVNRINVSSGQTGGVFTALDVRATVTGTPACTGYGIALYTQTDISGIATGQNAGVSHWTNINAGGDLTGDYYGVEIGIYESGADLTGIAGSDTIAPLCLRFQLDGTNAPGANTKYQMYLRSEAGGTHPDGLFACYTDQAIGMIAKTSAAVSHIIPIYMNASGVLASGTYYIMVSDTA